MTQQNPFNPSPQRPPYPNPLSLGSSAAVTTEVRMRAMRGRIAASILGIFATGGLIFKPVGLLPEPAPLPEAVPRLDSEQ